MEIIYGSIFTWTSLFLIVLFIVLNCINKKKVKFLSLMIGSVISVYGLICSVSYPFYFKRRINNDRLKFIMSNESGDFIEWACGKFYFFVLVSGIIAIGVIVISVIVMMISKNKENTKKLINTLTIFIQITIIFLALFMGLNTINKIFDVAGYIFGIAFYNALVLFGVYVFNKIYIKSKN